MKILPSLASILSVVSLCIILPGGARAQTIIPVETANNALVLQVTSGKDLQILYFGRRLSDMAEYARVSAVSRQPSDPSEVFNSAYTPSGSRNMIEPAISVAHADG